MLIEPEISGVSVVCAGNLNPKIFTPDWFARHELISAADADEAKVEIVHPQITIFTAGQWQVNVDTDRLSVTTTKGPDIQLHDLVVRTFKELLPHTPLRALGINRNVHFSVITRAARDEIGRKLAPWEPWGLWGEKFKSDDDAKRGGMQSLSMIQVGVDERPKGHVQVKVEPSRRIKGNVGIYMEVNDHYEIADAEKSQGSLEVISLLEKNFDASIRRSENIIDQIMRLKNV